MSERAAVLFVDMEYDYGIRAMGRSFGYNNLLLPLRDLYPDAIFFDHLERLAAVGRQAMNEELIRLVEVKRPLITIVVLYTDQFFPETIRALSRWTTVVGYFYDDVWRRDYANFWARHFDFVTTPERGGVTRFAEAGFSNAIHSAFAFNDRIYRRLDVQMEYDVSFVGGYHPYREWLIDRLRKRGSIIGVFGPGWPAGKVSTDDMVRIFNASRINLNISNSSEWELRYVMSSVKALKWTLRQQKRRQQLKGRHFEIAGAGGFQLTYELNGLEDYFAPGDEIVTYRGSRDLVSKVEFYLASDTERRRIARGGWLRAQAQHTARQRMAALIDEVLTRAASCAGATR